MTAMNLTLSAFIYIDPDHHDALEDVYPDPPTEHDVNTRPLSTPVAEVPMVVTILDIIASQKIDDSWQTIFSTMAQAKSFFFKGVDGVLRREHPSIPDLEHIVVPDALLPRILHRAHHSKMVGRPGRTRMWAHLHRTYY